MNPKSKQFCDLQKYWYQKLAEDGFKDIETDEVVLKKEADRSLSWFKDPSYRASKVEYYILIEHSLRENIAEFDEDYDYFIMVLWTKGYKKSEICRALESLNKKIHRNTVTWIIRKYESKWGVRQWKPNQMMSQRMSKI